MDSAFDLGGGGDEDDLFDLSEQIVSDSTGSQALLEKVESILQWPEESFSSDFPDYGVFSLQTPIPTITASISVDTYWNVYFGISGNLGAKTVWPSVKLAGGHLVASQEAIQDPGLLGVEWKTQSGIPSESKLESYMTGWSVSGGIGCVIGGDDVLTLSTTNPARIGTEQGFYTPHLGVSINHTWQIYDAGSSTPWFFQKW